MARGRYTVSIETTDSSHPVLWYSDVQDWMIDGSWLRLWRPGACNTLIPANRVRVISVKKKEEEPDETLG